MYYILALFLTLLLVYDQYLPYRVKRMLGIDPLNTKHKILNCKPCFSFWLTLPFAYIDLAIPMFIYIFIFIFENLKKS